jgi:plastocyanin
MIVGKAVAALGIGLATALGAALVAGSLGADRGPLVVDVTMRYSAFEPALISVPAGRPVTFVLVNVDPIDHEWIVGDAAVHERHRTGTEPTHAERPTEVSVGGRSERRTTITFDEPGTLTFVCHLPGHEAYGMTGTIVVTGG